MKKTLIAGAVLALCSQAAMAADDWRFAAGTDVWSAQGSGQAYGRSADGGYDDNYNWSGYLQLEHGIILLPNAKFEISDLSSSGGNFKNDLTAYDLSLYYRLFNNDLFQIDLGLTGRHYDGEQMYFSRKGYDEDMLMAYAGSEVRIPGTGVSFFGDVRSKDADNLDYRLGGAYKFSSVPVKLRAGWREAKVDFDGVDQRIDGWFMGGEFTF
ncbi:TIGR04219 family outer membrane beta-barrel protein [Aeromonas enteropelogenes]|uniref:TIGR04219 family outer membrane beta-barrel protein n=1 Tax=Aeromonas enteropelogenes TaxID=29489 RepID=UPI0005A7CDBA|nr:TIGR04219 family outer membrane beta-barrel protein [Aeromonas enteropelogenes]UBH28698.1 TIGR04219 family outer membrane beta-barrel protein [Aeromonas enteropelogenes]UBH54450.1 TIGR04219 family outer membrane beta-barrel protein [Aeromonas enteropelogenes]